MAKVVDSMPEGPRGWRGSSMWKPFSDGQVWMLTRKQDFTHNPDISDMSIRASAHQYAKRNDLVASVSIRGARIYVRFVKA